MKFIKNNYKFILGIVVGLLIAGGGVYAATITATSVSYSNSSSKISSTNVQGAIDELYNKAKDAESKCPEGYTCTERAYYAFGTPTTSSTTNFQEVISSSGSNVFIKLSVSSSGNVYSTCMYRNDSLSCFTYQDKTKLVSVFGESYCTDIIENGNNAGVICKDDNFSTTIRSPSVISFADLKSNHYCYIGGGTSVSCN